MRITKVDVHLVDIPAVEPAFVWRDGLPGSEPAGTMGWLTIETDEGITGFAPNRQGTIVKDIVDRRLRAGLIDQDPLAREYLWHRVWELDRVERFPAYISGMVDVALWDIAGKKAGMPVYQLLGSFRDEIPAYASTVTFTSIEVFLDVADQCLELGYTAIKLHAWGDVKRDAALCVALRKHVGDDVALMYDGSAGFDLMDATYLGHVLADAGYLWYEEPMKEFSVTAYKWLGERVRVPLLLGEVTEGAHMSAGDFLATGVASALRTSTELRGGFTGAMRIAHLADAYHLRAEVHGCGLEPAHLCMAIKNCTYYESLITSSTVVRPAEVDDRGMVMGPQAPGVGFEKQWQANGVPKGLASFTELP